MKLMRESESLLSRKPKSLKNKGNGKTELGELDEKVLKPADRKKTNFPSSLSNRRQNFLPLNNPEHLLESEEENLSPAKNPFPIKRPPQHDDNMCSTPTRPTRPLARARSKTINNAHPVYRNGSNVNTSNNNTTVTTIPESASILNKQLKEKEIEKRNSLARLQKVSEALTNSLTNNDEPDKDPAHERFSLLTNNFKSKHFLNQNKYLFMSKSPKPQEKRKKSRFNSSASSNSTNSNSNANMNNVNTNLNEHSGSTRARSKSESKRVKPSRSCNSSINNFSTNAIRGQNSSASIGGEFFFIFFILRKICLA